MGQKNTKTKTTYFAPSAFHKFLQGLLWRLHLGGHKDHLSSQQPSCWCTPHWFFERKRVALLTNQVHKLKLALRWPIISSSLRSDDHKKQTRKQKGGEGRGGKLTKKFSLFGTGVHPLQTHDVLAHTDPSQQLGSTRDLIGHQMRAFLDRWCNFSSKGLDFLKRADTHK